MTPEDCGGDCTVTVDEPLTVPDVAVIVTCPAPTAVITPLASTVARLWLDEAHVAVCVRSFVLPSLYVPVAVNACVAPTLTVAEPGETAMLCSVAAAGGGLLGVPPPLGGSLLGDDGTPPQAARRTI